MSQLLSPEEAHQKRSQIINEYKTEVRSIEKELKKKKLPAKQKESLEQRLELLGLEHEKRLAEFDEVQGTKSKREEKKEEEEAPPPVEEKILEERNWSSLSKKELEEECGRRALSKKGTKEDLTSRLNIYTLGAKSSAKASGVVAPAPKKPTEIQYETVDIPSAAPGASKDLYRNKRKKLWKRRGPPPTSPEAQPNDSDAPEPEAEERAKQEKREGIIAEKIASILKKHAKGIKVDDMPDFLEREKVKNFTPQLLGYESLEEWIANQPKHLLHFEKKSNLIYPPRVGELPSSESSSEEEDSDEDEEDDE